MSDYLWDRAGSDPEIEELERMLRPHAYRRPARRWRWAALAAAVVVAVAYGVWSRPGNDTRPAWDVEWLQGDGAARLPVGEWLETGAARARVTVADIGHVDLEPGSRVRLVGTGAHEHRLELARGKLEALVYAPPRLFVVETPSATAVDLGCAYSLEVDETGRGSLSVLSGHVELAGAFTCIVPDGAACTLRPGNPGVPYFRDAPAPLRDVEDLAAALAAARPRDTLTLWHLLPRVKDNDRARVCDRLAELAPLPDGVAREAILALDDDALEAWRDTFDW